MTDVSQEVDAHGAFDRKVVSIVIPCYNEEGCIAGLLGRLSAACQRVKHVDWVLIFVDDGSADSTSVVIREQLLIARSWCKGALITLSRNFGKEAALLAGLDQCKGDACIIMDADLQDPPEIIPDMIALWREGYQVVSAKREDRSVDHWSKRFTALAFYWLFAVTSKLSVEVDASDYRLLGRQVVAAICGCRESVRFSKGFFAWAGFSTALVTYQRAARLSGATKWGSWRLWNYALDGIFNFSTAPLRIWSYFGFAVTSLSFCLGLRILFMVLHEGVTVPGYASLFVLTSFLGGVQLVGLGVIGEYIGRSYLESKRRPVYVIREIVELSAQ